MLEFSESSFLVVVTMAYSTFFMQICGPSDINKTIVLIFTVFKKQAYAYIQTRHPYTFSLVERQSRSGTVSIAAREWS